MGSFKKMESDFQYYFDNQHGDVVIAGISFSPSDILKEMDPIAYNEEFHNWMDIEMNLETL